MSSHRWQSVTRSSMCKACSEAVVCGSAHMHALCYRRPPVCLLTCGCLLLHADNLSDQPRTATGPHHRSDWHGMPALIPCILIMGSLWFRLVSSTHLVSEVFCSCCLWVPRRLMLRPPQWLLIMLAPLSGSTDWRYEGLSTCRTWRTWCCAVSVRQTPSTCSCRHPVTGICQEQVVSAL